MSSAAVVIGALIFKFYLLPAMNGTDVYIFITKTCLFKYTESFTIKKWKVSGKKSYIFHISAQTKQRLWVLIRIAKRGGSNEYP